MKGKRAPVVFFLVDAMREDYIHPLTTPFLHDLSERGERIQRVLPSQGFCERTEILTGQTPDQSGFLMAIGYDPPGSDYRAIPFLKGLNAVERHIPEGPWRRRIRSRVGRLVRRIKPAMSPCQIPWDFLPFFSLTEDRFNHTDYGAFGVPSLLDELRDAGRKFDYSAFTALGWNNGSDEDRLRRALSRAEQASDFQLVFIGVLDEVGHHHGPRSEHMRSTLKKLDGSLKSFVHRYQDIHPGARFVFLGDHGMMDVDKRIDIQAALLEEAGKLNLRRCKDFVYFIDSTAFRLWFESDRARARLLESMKDNKVFRENGRFIDQTSARRAHMPWEDRRYGDVLWWAHPGVLLSPDFFHMGENILGMHGYEPTSPGSQGTCIYWGEGVRAKRVASAHLSEIHGLLRRSLFSLS